MQPLYLFSYSMIHVADHKSVFASQDAKLDNKFNIVTLKEIMMINRIMLKVGQGILHFSIED